MPGSHQLMPHNCFFRHIYLYSFIEVLDAVFSLLHIYTQGKAAKQEGNIFIYSSSISYLLFVPKASQVPGNFFRIRAVLPIYLIPVKGQPGPFTVFFSANISNSSHKDQPGPFTRWLFLQIYIIPVTRVHQDHLHSVIKVAR